MYCPLLHAVDSETLKSAENVSNGMNKVYFYVESRNIVYNGGKVFNLILVVSIKNCSYVVPGKIIHNLEEKSLCLPPPTLAQCVYGVLHGTRLIVMHRFSIPRFFVIKLLLVFLQV